MIYYIELLSRKLKRWINRSEWLLLSQGPKAKPTEATTELAKGLIIIQVDGLAFDQLNTALVNKRMPFLQKLINKEHYHLHTLYSGAPSTTPAVQAELFYGVKTAVPAFSFKSQYSQKVVRMDRSQASMDVEKHLLEQAEPLLKEGSSYSNIYRGGAKEANFCASSIGWSGIMKIASVPAIIFFLLLNVYSFIRVMVLMIIEFSLAFVDFFRGLIARRNLLRELQFVPTRVVISILLRELVTIGTKLDIAKGLPIVHLNFLGYDEQAHRRGPSSNFAHWSLKGIDDAIGRIWRAAKSSSRRDYEIWIYSDHGQQETVPYETLHGESVSDAINRVIRHDYNTILGKQVVSQILGIESQRVRYLGGKWLQKLLPFHNDDILEQVLCERAVTITAMGPIGSIYLPTPLDPAQTEKLAIALIKDAKIPLVFGCQPPAIGEHKSDITVWNKNGVYKLPQDRVKIFGESHPFLQEVTQDIMRLCQQPESGTLLFSGFNQDQAYCTFTMENGSHGGPGPQETKAFALLPSDTLLPLKDDRFLRPADLYDTGLHLLGRKSKPA
jgi:hypothetical protein